MMPYKDDWWKDFFSGLSVELWKQAIGEEQTHAEVEFIMAMVRVKPPARLLDIPCGSGRLSLELAARGFSLTGVDLSAEALDAARSDAASRNLKVAWLNREMRDLPWNEEFDGAFCFGNSFGYLNDDGNARFLKKVHQALKPGCMFILDSSSIAELVLPKIKDRTKMQFGNILFLEENEYDHVHGRLNTNYTFIRGKQREQKFGSHRLYTYRELLTLLKVSGFRTCESFGSPSREPFSLKGQGLYIVASRE